MRWNPGGDFKDLGELFLEAAGWCGREHSESSPTIFWFRVARELLLGALFAAVFLSILASLGQKTVVALFTACAVVYASLLVVTSMCRAP